MNKQTNDTLDELISNHKRRKKKTIIVLFLIMCSIILLPIKILRNIDKNKFENYNICNRDTFMDKFDYISNQQLAYYNIDENTRYHKDPLIYEDNINRGKNDFEEYMTGKGWIFKVESLINGSPVIIFEKLNVHIESTRAEIRFTDYYAPTYLSVETDDIDKSYSFDPLDSIDEIEEINNDFDILLNSEENSILKEFVVDINDYSEQACSKLESKNN